MVNKTASYLSKKVIPNYVLKQASRTTYSPITLLEQISLETHKEQVDHYVEGTITDQELLDQSTLIVINEGENPHIINLHLE